MKLSVMGFSQSQCIEKGVTLQDLFFLDWFAYFYSSQKMKTIIVEDQVYGWIDRGYVLEQLPMLGIVLPENLSRMLTRLVNIGLLKRVVKANEKQRGKAAYYRPTEMLDDLRNDHVTISTRETDDHVFDSTRVNDDHVLSETLETPRPRVPKNTSDTTTRRDTPSKNDTPTKDADKSAILAELLCTLHQQTDPKYKADHTKWATDIDKLNRIDGRDWAEIEAVIRWVKQPDNFWLPNIMSGRKLREKFPALIVQQKRDQIRLCESGWTPKKVIVSKETDFQRLVREQEEAAR